MSTIFERTANVNMKVLCEIRHIPRLCFNFEIVTLEPDIIAQAITKSKSIRRIEVNELYVSKYKSLILNEIIPHEVCHLAQHYIEFDRGFKHHSHGKLWHTLMNQLGYKYPKETYDI